MTIGESSCIAFFFVGMRVDNTVFEINELRMPSTTTLRQTPPLVHPPPPHPLPPAKLGVLHWDTFYLNMKCGLFSYTSHVGAYWGCTTR